MIFKQFCILVLWTQVASALEGLSHVLSLIVPVFSTGGWAVVLDGYSGFLHLDLDLALYCH